jgi:hypothetical protein
MGLSAATAAGDQLQNLIGKLSFASVVLVSELDLLEVEAAGTLPP